MKIEGKLIAPRGKNKYWAATIPIAGIHTQGKSRTDALAMAKDAIESLANKEGFSVICEEAKSNSFFVSATDIGTFVSFILSRIRAESHMTARAAAHTLGSNSPNAYARYERGGTIPRLDTLEAMLKAVNPLINVVLKVG